MKISIQVVEQPDESPAPKRVVDISENGGSIGRAFDCSLQLPGPGISRLQARIEKADNGFTLTDCGKNPISVNLQPAPREMPQALYDGDVISIAGFSLLVTDIQRGAETRQRGHSTEADQHDIEDKPDECLFSDPMQISNEDIVASLDPDPQPAPSASLDYVGEQLLQEFSEHIVGAVQNRQQGQSFGEDPFEITPDMSVLAGTDESELASGEVSVISRPENTPSAGVGDDDRYRRIFDATDGSSSLMRTASQTPPGATPDQLTNELDEAIDQFVLQFSPTVLQEQLSNPKHNQFGREKSLWKAYCGYFMEKYEKKEFHAQFRELVRKQYHETELRSR